MPIYNETMTGGGIGGGTGPANLVYTLGGSGGGVGSGTATVQFVFSNVGSGGGVGGGSALFHRVYNVKMTGGGIGGGYYIGKYAYKGTGGVTVGGSAPYTVRFDFSSPQTWNVNGVISFTKTFFWDDGETPKKWYRITGCCRYPTSAGDGIGAGQPGGCSVIPFQSQDSKCAGALGKNTFIQNIVARNLAEVCRILKDEKWTWPICDISVFSRPADNRFVDPQDNCNQLNTVPIAGDGQFCSIPACMEFCLHTDGIVDMGMDTQAGVSLESYRGRGGVTVGGKGSYRIIGGGSHGPDQQHVSGGGVIVGGAGRYRIISVSTGYPIDMGMDAQIQDFEVLFSNTDTSAADLQQETTTINTNCVGCRSLPLVLNLVHNVGQGAVLREFAIRNGFNIPTNQLMHYSNRLDSWVSTLHYTGVGDDKSQEYWRILFDWSCVNDFQTMGKYAWRFGVSVVRKNLQTGESKDTRLLVTFPPNQLCVNSLTQGFDFKFGFNTQHLTSGSLDKTIVADSTLLYDSIGMFRSRAWVERPNVLIEVSQNSVPIGFTQQDISSIFPQKPVLGA